MATAVGSVQLKGVLGEIQSVGAHLVHGRLLEWPATPSLWHTTAAGGVYTIRPLQHRSWFAEQTGNYAALTSQPRPRRYRAEPVIRIPGDGLGRRIPGLLGSG